MNKIKFTKMHCAGNHYVYLFSNELHIKNLSSSFLSQLAIKDKKTKIKPATNALCSKFG